MGDIAVNRDYSLVTTINWYREKLTSTDPEKNALNKFLNEMWESYPD